MVLISLIAIFSLSAFCVVSTNASQLEKRQTCKALYSQCGGQSYTGSTACCAGSCVYQSSWYSQCRPNAATSPIVTTTKTSPPTSPTPNDGLPAYKPPAGWNIDPLPIDPQATLPTKQLYRKLTNLFQRYMISGQSETSWNVGKESDDITYVFQQTGKYPIVRLFDLMDHYPGRPDNNAIQRMKDWHAAGGVVQLQWHWRAPIGVREFYTDRNAFDVSKAVQAGTAENAAILADIDYIIPALKNLQDAKIPILWRPLHEGHGTWFWWGAKGAAPLKQLWIIVQDRLLNAGVHNLIHVANFNDCAACYPALNRFDIISNDKYGGKNDFATHAAEFNTHATQVSKTKIVAMTENDGIPDPDACKAAGTMWSWFGTWNTEFITGMDTNHLKKVYSHPLVLTRDEWAAAA